MLKELLHCCTVALLHCCTVEPSTTWTHTLHDLLFASTGKFDVFVATTPKGPKAQVMTYDGQGSFGELSLMYGKPRAATIVAQTNGVLWSLERRAFRRLVMKSSAKSLMGTLKSVVR